MVVDTNIWVSAVISPDGPPAQILAALVANQFTLVTSTPLLQELAGVLARPRMAQKYAITAEKAATLVALLRQAGELAPVSGHTQVCRDPDDDTVIETALSGDADVLVSRDDDLKRAPEVATELDRVGIEVLSVRAFLDLLRKRAADIESSDVESSAATEEAES